MDYRRVHSILHHHEARPDARGVFVDHDQSIAVYINEAKMEDFPRKMANPWEKSWDTDTIVHRNISQRIPCFNAFIQ
jgi:hypothetical protein